MTMTFDKTLLHFRPLSRRLGVLTEDYEANSGQKEMFPYPRELNGGSYLLVSVVLQLMPFCFRTLPR